MTEKLRHRGPDDSGVWVDERAGVALGHRRLAVIDLSPDGRQPMESGCGRYVFVFNGELYNYRHLRRELESEGTRFRGQSDTEVLLAALAAWGLRRALQRSNGMFAFALWDRAEGRLHLARDRLGEKPLYYGRIGGAFVFASELKALQVHPGFKAEVDRDVLSLYLRFNYVPGPWSIYSGILKLPPGSVLTVSPRDNETPPPEPYWSALEIAAKGAQDLLTLSEREAVDALEALLADATALRMQADVPLGAFLSGGIDSSTVVALMQAAAASPVRTFTIGSPSESYDEAADARRVAHHLGTDHTELRVTPTEAVAVIPRLPTLYDEPFADSSQIPTFLVADLARKSVTVSLSGDGGDEIFGGYNRYTWLPRLWRSVGRVPPAARNAISRGLLTVPPDTWTRLGGLLPARLRPRIPATKIAKIAKLMTASDMREMFVRVASEWQRPDELVPFATERLSAVTDPASWPSLPDPVRQMMHLDLVSYLPDDILVKLDRATMAVSLEGRVPFLDHRVVEFAARLPMDMKVRGRTRKWLLRQVLHRHVPAQLVDRPKFGFGVPVGEWLRGPLRPWAEELLHERRLRDDGYLNAAPIREAWAQHLSGRHDLEYQLWGVLMFQAWLEHGARPGSAAASPTVGISQDNE